MNQRDQKKHNQLTLLEALRTQSPISQAALAASLLLQPSTVSNLMRDFKSAGLVTAVAKGVSGSEGGKKADLLTLDSGYGCFGGIYLRNDSITSRVLDFSEGVVLEDRRSITTLDGDEITSEISVLLEKHADKLENYRGAGIAVSSVVTAGGDIVPSSHFEKSVPGILRSLHERHPDLELVLENDANALAYYTMARSREIRPAILHLLVREDPFTIGAGLVLNGIAYRGISGAAGEIDEEVLAGGSHADGVERLVRFLKTFLDLGTVYVSSTENSPLTDAIKQSLAAAGTGVRHTGDNAKAMNGAAMLAMQKHTEVILPLSGRKRRTIYER